MNARASTISTPAPLSSSNDGRRTQKDVRGTKWLLVEGGGTREDKAPLDLDAETLIFGVAKVLNAAMDEIDGIETSETVRVAECALANANSAAEEIEASSDERRAKEESKEGCVVLFSGCVASGIEG